MGLIVPQIVKVRINKRMCKYYREKGYKFKKCGDIIEVNVLDLQRKSAVIVKCTCDFCGKITEIQYRKVVVNKENNTLIACDNKDCMRKKKEDTNLKRYGVKNPSQAQEIKNKKIETCKNNFGCEYPLQSEIIQNKKKATCKERYGVEYAMQNKEIQDRMKTTCKERYGVEHAIQNKEIQDRIKATCKERYGVEYVIQNKEIQNKMKDTCKERYGVENPLQSEEIKNKVLNSFQFNGTGPCSRAQRYINHILNGTLNKCICGSLVDIYMEKENIVIEHDGGGHFLRDKMNGNIYPTKESLLYEKEREDKIINNGYRMIRFIAAKDRIPSDEVILNLIEGFKNSDFKVIRINFEENTIDRDYEEKWYCNFGKLRKITKEDLEKFEKQEENTSEN